ncbi:MAG: hypothetical protein HC916_22320 [Coleofasciculaceae cyanobacterium SM2_1_6]|nr:hypothetical protein [Coleofasciculaceae cyanobacterium SM2_1_6]
MVINIIKCIDNHEGLGKYLEAYLEVSKDIQDSWFLGSFPKEISGIARLFVWISGGF